MKREPIESLNAKEDYLKWGHWCSESEVRALEKDYADLERKLKIAENNGQWVSVTDRLPDKYGLYFVLWRGTVLHPSVYRYRVGIESHWEDEKGIHVSDVVYWMPPPELTESLPAMEV